MFKNYSNLLPEFLLQPDRQSEGEDVRRSSRVLAILIEEACSLQTAAAYNRAATILTLDIDALLALDAEWR